MHPIFGLKKPTFFAKSMISVLLVYGGGVTDLGLNPKIKILTKSSFRISTKIQLGFNITSTKHQQKKLTKLQLQILPELQLQNLDQTLYSKSKQKFCFMIKPQLPNLQQTVADTILMINISNRNNLNKL